ncbi:hypothetical protein N2152v2_005359 [Parachlorella kessleri]
MRHLRQLFRSLGGGLRSLGLVAPAAQAVEVQAGVAAAESVAQKGVPSTASRLRAAVQQQWRQPAAPPRLWQGPFVMDATSHWSLQLQSLSGMAAQLEPVLEQGSMGERIEWQADSVMRKRKRKMNKHKHKKRLKRDRRKSR